MSGNDQKTLRKEDASLLSGRGRYADDLPVPVGTLHAHVVRSPHAHADIVRIDARAALAHDGVWAVITGEDVRKLSEPFLGAVKTPVRQWSLAVERVRYVGEPVALVVAESRYIAEDAAELVGDRVRTARRRDRSARGVRERRAAVARRGEDQRSLGARISLWRYRGGVRPRRPPHRHDHGVSAAVVYADRMLRRRRPAQSGRGQLRRAGEFSGPVFHPSGDGARAARAGAETAPAHSAGFRRQLRHQAFGVSLRGADGAGGAHHRPAGKVGRGPHRASGRGELRAQPGDQDRSGGHQRRAAFSRCGSISSRITARSCARRCRVRSTACTARSPAPTTSPTWT